MNSKILSQAAEAIIYKKGNEVIKDRISKSYRIKELDNKIRKSRTKSEIKLLIKASQIILVPVPLTNNKFSPSGGGAGKPNNYQIIMPFIKGKKLSENLDSFPLKKQKQILNYIGQDVAKLHNVDIIHGDLTTSNMILVENNSPASQKNNLYIHKKRGNKVNCDKKIKSCTNLNKSDLVLINKQISANKGEQQIGVVVGGEVGFKVYFIDFGLGYISKKIEGKAVDIHLLKQALEAKHFKNWESLFKEFEKGYVKDYPESKIILKRLKVIEKRGRYKH